MKDSVTILVDALVYYSVFDAMLAVCELEIAGTATQLLAETTLRNMMRTKSLQEILAHKVEAAKVMQEFIDEVTDAWGICFERVEGKDVKLPALSNAKSYGCRGRSWQGSKS